MNNCRFFTPLKKEPSLDGEEGSSDIFVKRLSLRLERKLITLLAETQKWFHQEVELLEALQTQINIMEERIHECIPVTPAMELLISLPGEEISSVL